MSRNGTIATADTGPERFGITLIEPPGKYGWSERHVWARTPDSTVPEIADPDWKSVAAGIAFDEPGKSIWVSEGSSGRVRQIDLNTGDTRRTVGLNAPGSKDSVTGDMTFDSARRLLFVTDEANSRIVLIDAKNGHVISSAPTALRPSAIDLSPDKTSLWAATADSVCAINVSDPPQPESEGCVRAGSPNGIRVNGDHVFVSNLQSDSITVLDREKRTITAEIPLRIPSLEKYRGIKPAGLAWDPVTKWLLVAESGINAVGVVDTEKNTLIGHIPAGWMPTRVLISGDRVYVANALGRGTGPQGRHVVLNLGELPSLYHGSVTTFIMLAASEIPRYTEAVFVNNGFLPRTREAQKWPDAIRHVVLIEQDGHSFDEVLGDVAAASNSKVLSFPKLARFGMHGNADGGRTRFSIQDAPITPNQHAIAHAFAFSDNFYLDEGDAGDWWRHIEGSGVSSQKIASTQAGAITALKAMKDLSGLTYIRLEEDRSAQYPYEASAVEAGDFAIGRVVDFLSHSPWWRDMVVFVRHSGTQEGLDHVDSHRTVLLAAGPYVKRNYVSHVNASFPALLRTALELLHIEPFDLEDATASSLYDIFTSTPEYAPYAAIMPDRRIFEPAAEK